MGDNKYFKDLGYKVTSTYNWRVLDHGKEFHPGVDLVGKPQCEIGSFCDGVVVFAGEAIKGSGYGGFGNAVAVKDKNGCIHVYGHILKWLVKKGDKVVKGQKLCIQGNTGRSIGTAHGGYLPGEHLHYEVRKSEVYVEDREKRCYVPDDYLIKLEGGKVDATPAPKAEAPKASAPKSSGKVYVVKSGDTLSKIAKDNGTSVDALMKLNTDIKDAGKISIGQKIKLG